MSTQVQFRRGNTAQTSTFTGAVAEITVDTDKETIVVHDGLTAGGFPLARESALSSNLTFTQAAFDKANTANITAEAGFSKANSSNVLAQAAFDKANVANTIANSGYAFANTVNIKVDSAFAFSNTVNIKTDAAFAFANTVNIKTDASFTKANAANVLAQAAFDKANSVTQQGFVTVAANGTNVVADANNDTLTLSAADGVGITSNATTDTITINLTPTGVTSGTYGSASIVPVFVVNAQGRLSSVTNTTIAISSSAVSGTFGFSSGGTNATSYTTGTLLVSNGTAIVSLANTGTAGTYANASHVPVITTDAYGRVSSVTNTSIAIAASQVTSGALSFARGGTNAASYTTGTLLTSNGTAIISLANTGTAGTYGNSTFVPVITTDAYGRVSSVTNTAIVFPSTLANTGTSVTANGLTVYTFANTTVSTSNTTGAVVISGGLGVKGNIYADAIYDSGIEVIAFANQAFNLANTANITAEAGFGRANSANILAQAAFNKANTALANTGGSISGDLTITGNLTVVGQQVYANTQTVLIKDNIITLNAAIDQSSAPSANAGLEIDRGSSANVYLLWNENSDVWQFTNDGTTYYTIADTSTLSSAFNLANTANITAEAAFARANAANILAQAAFNQANTANIKIDSGYAFSNTVNIKTDAAFAFANTVNIKTDAAFNQANSVYLPSVTRLNVTNDGSVAYLIDQYSGNNPTIYINAGETIAFNLNVTGHPFMIRVSSGSTNYNTGLTHVSSNGTVSTNASAQGQVTGTLYWKVPFELSSNNYVYQCSVHGGMVGTIRIGQPNAIILTHANAAFDKANSANILAQAAFDKANTNILAQAAFDKANTANVTSEAAFSKANAANVLAQSAFNAANSANIFDYTTISTTAGVYGNSTFIPVITLAANGRVSSITNTAITGFANATFSQSAFDKANSANILAQAAFDFANTANGGSAFDNVARVQANTATQIAQGAFDKANQTAQLAFTTVSANGTSLVADANNDTLTITAAVANGIQILANATSDTLDIGLKPSGVTAGIYGNTSTAVTITIDQFGRITSVSQTAITAVETDPLALAFAIALG